MSVLTLASAPEDARALEDARAHHARLAGELAGRVKTLITAVDWDPNAAETIHANLVVFCDRALLPHAAAEEAALYPVAHRLPDARLLVESMLGEHRRLTALVDALRDAPGPVEAAPDARALQVLFEEHAAKENDILLPLLAAASSVSLAGLLAETHRRFADARRAAGHGDEEDAATGGDSEAGGAAEARGGGTGG
ncbi:hemerythrin domain-containing protein, partial [Actinomadura logoneensis]